MQNYWVVKKHKRLMIVDQQDQCVYSPPDFLAPHLKTRTLMWSLAEHFEEYGRDIDAIVTFEGGDCESLWH